MWAKKIRKKLHYFGSWRNDRDGIKALETFNREWPYLSEGCTPPPANISTDGCTLRELINDFLTAKKKKLEAGELSPRSFRDYYKSCEALLDHFGKDRRVDDLRPGDFRGFRAKLAQRYSVVTLKNEINRVRILFNYAHENELVEKPVRYGQDFDRPSAKQLRRDRNQVGPKLYTAAEIHTLINTADVHLRAMIHLGINCGFGNTDCATLPTAAVDLQAGWIDYPRPKTEIPRRIPLWPETIVALEASLAERPEPKQPTDARLCFLTRQGRPWVRVRPKKTKSGEDLPVPVDAVARQFSKLVKNTGINGRRGLGFYTLRHCFETVGGESKDQVAVDAIMGHVDNTMAGNYRHAISDERLRAVVDVVRAWLYPPPDDDASETAASVKGGTK